jgi:hypothetical protein
MGSRLTSDSERPSFDTRPPAVRPEGALLYWYCGGNWNAGIRLDKTGNEVSKRVLPNRPRSALLRTVTEAMRSRVAGRYLGVTATLRKRLQLKTRIVVLVLVLLRLTLHAVGRRFNRQPEKRTLRIMPLVGTWRAAIPCDPANR